MLHGNSLSPLTFVKKVNNYVYRTTKLMSLHAAVDSVHLLSDMFTSFDDDVLLLSIMWVYTCSRPLMSAFSGY